MTRRLACYVGAILLLFAAEDARAQDGDWGVAGGVASYHGIGIMLQAEGSVWLGEWLRVGPMVRGIWIPDLAGDQPVAGHPAPNPVRAVGSFGLRLTSEARSSSGNGIFFEAAAMPTSLQNSNDMRWGFGGGLRTSSFISLEIGALGVAESSHRLGTLLYVSLGRNDGWRFP